MHGRRRVLSTSNGSWQARWLFVAEAPGRRGAERTGIPFTGDESGRRFDLLLDAMRLTRADAFITNAVLCNPCDELGRNAAPTRQELDRCAPWLLQTLQLVEAPLVIAVGKTALGALDRIAPHDLTLAHAGQAFVPWRSGWLGVLYHPSPRAAIHRNWEMQLHDARHLATLGRRRLKSASQMRDPSPG
jgi:uracil-DNA glycosylase family 4